MTVQKGISRQTGVENEDYKWGFDFDIESDIAPKGLNENIVKLISNKKGEPEWMLEWRLKAYKHWLTLGNKEPEWANINYPSIDFIIIKKHDRWKINL